MISEDTRFRNLRLWEETSPCPPPGVSPADDDARLEGARVGVAMGRDHVAERLRSMLPQSADGPTEDHDLMALEFKAQYFLVSAHIPTYADWFAHCDMEPTYRYEKRVLKLLQWKTPEKRWRLKSPTHTLFLDAYEKVFPEARFVQTHRDVSKVLPSVSDLYLTMLQIGNPDIDPGYVGELNMEQWSLALERCLAFRRQPGPRGPVLRHRLQPLPSRSGRRDTQAVRVAGRRPLAGHRAEHAGLEGGQPEGQVRSARLRRQPVRDHRGSSSGPLRGIPPAIRPAASLR